MSLRLPHLHSSTPSSLIYLAAPKPRTCHTPTLLQQSLASGAHQGRYQPQPTVCCRYLFKSNSDGVQDYLCNRLCSLPETGTERYLSQLCQLLINKPRTALEEVIVKLCASSLRIAVKVRPAWPSSCRSLLACAAPVHLSQSCRGWN